MAANSTVHGRIGSYLEFIQDFMTVLVTCKNEIGPIKTEAARVLIALNIDFQMLNGRYPRFYGCPPNLQE